jgi:hypothetical protein
VSPSGRLQTSHQMRAIHRWMYVTNFEFCQRGARGVQRKRRTKSREESFVEVGFVLVSVVGGASSVPL